MKSPRSQSPFEQFESLAKKIVRVPRQEALAQEQPKKSKPKRKKKSSR